MYVPALWSTAMVTLYEVIGLRWLAFPWLPMSVLGTAVAFYLGFKNSSSYDRTWEARKIWGGIVNASRSWTYGVRDLVGQPFTGLAVIEAQERTEIHRNLIHRHVAWMDALRHQLRRVESWEHQGDRDQAMRQRIAPERSEPLEMIMTPHLQPQESAEVRAAINPAFHLIGRQSAELRGLRERNLIETFAHIKLQNILDELMALQGKAERIKKFPFPRQYATVNGIFAWLYTLLVPMALVSEFEKLGPNYVWMTIPFATMVSWVFLTTDRIGDWSENPFEGLANDVPISTMSRGIERDIKELLGETELPPARAPVGEIQM